MEKFDLTNSQAIDDLTEIMFSCEIDENLDKVIKYIDCLTTRLNGENFKSFDEFYGFIDGMLSLKF